jgi:malate dehydrogenase (oxaloacetate-decarboxylating)
MHPTNRYFDLREDDHGRPFLAVAQKGVALLRNVLTNKGTAFTEEERIDLALDGLLPPAVNTLEQQLARNYEGYRALATPLMRYQYLRSLQERNEILYFALVSQHLAEMLPIIYTPTVGDAVVNYSHLYQTARGLSFSPATISRAGALAENYPTNDVKMIVATDSSAILGIGDQGYGGLAIPIGKLSLYTVGGVAPYHTLPVALDVGTDSKEKLDDPMYLGVRQKRLRGEAYLALVDAFVDAIAARWPEAIVQWEDLAKDTAFTVLDRYRDKIPSFNDDIQGTGAVALAGLLAACSSKGERFIDQVVVIHGAGAGGIGVATAIREGMVRQGLSREDATARIWVLDSKGLLVQGTPMDDYKRPFAHPKEALAGWKIAGALPSLYEVVPQAKATVLLGLSGRHGAFDEAVVRAVGKNVARPIVFALSNPTSSCEAIPADVIRWTDGAAIVATGSPFDPVTHAGHTREIGQGNNAFVFPGLGFGAILARAKKITDAMVLDASFALAKYIEEKHLPQGRIYPPVTELGEVSVIVAAQVMRTAVHERVGSIPDGVTDLDAWVRARFWQPRYLPIVHEPALAK